MIDESDSDVVDEQHQGEELTPYQEKYAENVKDEVLCFQF